MIKIVDFGWDEGEELQDADLFELYPSWAICEIKLNINNEVIFIPEFELFRLSKFFYDAYPMCMISKKTQRIISFSTDSELFFSFNGQSLDFCVRWGRKETRHNIKLKEYYEVIELLFHEIELIILSRKNNLEKNHDLALALPFLWSLKG